MKVIGLTGSIGMGKSTTAAMFAKLGAAVHDSDHEARAVLAPGGAAVPDVISQFPDAEDQNAPGQIDRATLRQIVFDDDIARKQLEAIIHPYVWKSQADFLTAAKAKGTKYAVLDIPLLFETGANMKVDFTVVVSAPFFKQRMRVLARKGMTHEIFQKVLNSQLPDRDKRRLADYVVDTGLNRHETFSQVRGVLKDINKQRLAP